VYFNAYLFVAVKKRPYTEIGNGARGKWCCRYQGLSRLPTSL